MRILYFFRRWLCQISLEFVNDRLDILVSKADDCAVVDNYVGEESIGFCVVVCYRCLIIFCVLPSLVAPLKPRHGVDTNEHDRTASDSQECHAPREEH